jgi:hypothetical protein
MASLETRSIGTKKKRIMMANLDCTFIREELTAITPK